MRAREFIIEGKLNITKNDLGNRIFYTASLSDEHKDWIQKAAGNKINAEATVDISSNAAHINRIDAFGRGQGYGTELLAQILEDLRSSGKTEVTAYIENSNADSRNLFRKFGFTETKRTSDGSYWTLTL